ncbi:MAG TPA: hypothetical protein VGF77_17535 [Allosphingosinicella sp.]|jgi:hypothetical protein
MPLTRDQCLKRRLLFACLGSYAPADPIFRTKAGWTADPDLIEDPDPAPGNLHIDAALVGQFAEGVVVAFRGTLPPIGGDGHTPEQIFFDWLNNFDFRATKDADYPGLVHEGFAGSLNRLWTPLQAAVNRHLTAAPVKRLLVTGHSKGGALANLAAWRWRGLAGIEAPIHVFTVAAARSGNEEWKAAYDAELRILCTRYESALDVVPWVPFGQDTPGWVRKLLGNSNVVLASIDYVPVGTRIPATTSFFDNAQAILRAARFLVQPKQNVEQYIEVLGLSHAIDSGSGYDKLICEPGCAPVHHVV